MNIRFPRLYMSSALVALLAYSGQALADCIDNADGTFTCSGVSQNLDPQTGETTLDNASGDVTLTNDGIISNDNTTATVGPVRSISANGGSNVEINNNGEIYVDRSTVILDPSLNNADPGTGALLNGPDAVGVAAAIYTEADTPLLTINNNGYMYAGDFNFMGPSDYSAVIFGSGGQQIINNNSDISNNWFSYGTDTLQEGHWAIANFGAGDTAINNVGNIVGDIILVDRNPLLTAAQLTADQLGVPLPLAYNPGDVGIRNSVINNSGYIASNIYLGSGTHVINNDFIPDTAMGTIAGSIYVDQRDAVITDAAGNPVSTVAGSREFTFNNSGDFQGNITINDVAGAVNTVTFQSGLTDSSGSLSPTDIYNSITGQGLGNTTVNFNCNFDVTAEEACTGSGSISEVTTLNITGTKWRLGYDENFPLAYQVTGDINLSAANVLFAPGATLDATNVIIGSGTLLQGIDRISPVNNEVEYGFGSINANLISNGAIDLRATTLNVSGNATFNSGAKLFTFITRDTNGQLAVGGTGTMDNATTIVPTLASGIFISNGQSFTIANNTTGNPLVQNGNGIVQFTTSDVSGNLMLVANVALPETLTSTMSKGGSNALNTLFNYQGDDPALVQLGIDIQALSRDELSKTGERLRPEINDGAIRAVLTNTDHVLGIVESHLFDIYLASLLGETSLSAGDKPSVGAGIWVQGFGNSGAQDSRKNVDGYSTTSSGVAFGADRLFGNRDDIRVGGAFSYASGNVDNTGITNINRIDINSYMGMVYAAWNLDDWYLNGAIGVGRNTYDSKRSALGRMADGQHDSWQFTTKLDVGWPIQWNDVVTFVPLAALSYNYIDESGYKEKGKYTYFGGIDPIIGQPVIVETNSPIALKIEGRDFHSLRSGLGGKVLFSLQQEDWNAGIELRALYSHEFGDIAQDSTARFIAGGASFRSPGMKPARDGIILGSSVRLTGNDDNDQITLLASYDADIRDEYFGQSVTMMLRYDFDQGPSYLKRAAAQKAAAKSRMVTTKSVEATEQDIANIQQALAPSETADIADGSGNPLEQKAIGAAIDNWVNSLTNKNADGYFKSYASDFETSDGSTRQQWERKRRLEISRDGNPSITISYLTVKPQGNQVSAVFTQTVKTGDARETILKRVDFTEKNGRWLIVKEAGMAVPEYQ